MSQTKRTSFTGSLGGKLDARLELPDDPPMAYALFAHCFTCSKDYIAAARISRALADRGIAVLRFDFTGLGQSEGDFANTNFSTNVADVIRAADYLREHYEAPKMLIGHSLGGAAVLAAAHRVAESLVVATIAAPSEPAHITRHFAEQLPDIENRGETEVRIAGRPFRVQKQFLEDVGRYEMQALVANLGRALFVFHSQNDDIVEFQHSQRLFEWASQPKSLISLDEADHLVTRREDAEYVADVLAAWAVRSIPKMSPRAAPESKTSQPGTVIVTESGRGRFTQTIHLGPHAIVADEPENYGGDNAGPTPYDLLLASFGACTSMTIRMYAGQKQLPLQHVEVTLRHDKIHARDCEDCETKEGRIDHIERMIELRGDLDEAQRARLLEIADKCPVHRTLCGEIRVTTRLRDGRVDTIHE